MIRFGYVQSGVQRFAEWTEEFGLVCEDDLLSAVNVLIAVNAPVRCSWVGYFMEASLDTAVQAWGTINTGLRWCSGIDLVRSTPPLIEYDEFSDPEEDLFEKAMSRSEAGKIAANARWRNHVKASVANSIIDRVRAYGGLSVKMLTGEEPTSGYMVAQRGHNLEVPSADFFDPAKGQEILKKYLIEKKNVFGKEQYLGLWYDSANDEVVLDVVDNIQKKSDATREGAERNQQAIWDVKGQREISTGGSGDRESEPAIDVSKTAGSVIGDERRRNWASSQRYLGEVYGDTQALIEFDKAKFSSRSEAGRYAAHIRWMNQRGMTPMTVEQWKTQNTGGSERMRKIQSMQADVSGRLQKLNDLLSKSGLTTEAMWNLSRYGKDDYLVVDAKDWGKTSITDSSQNPLATWLVEVQFEAPDIGWTKYKVPNAEVMALMEDVKTLGALIEEEAQERANAGNLRAMTGAEAAREYISNLASAQREITHYQTLTTKFLDDFLNFKPSVDDGGSKFEQYAKSGKPELIGNILRQDTGESLAQFIESQNITDEKVLISALMDKTSSLVNDLNKLGFDQNTLAKHRREVLAEIRSFGADEGTPYEIVTGFNFPNGAPVEVRIANAMQNLPTAWIDNLKTYTQKTTHKALRAKTVHEMQSGFIESAHIIQTSANTQTAFVVHELIHAVEAAIPAVRVMTHAFGVNRRVGNFRPSDEKFGSTFSKRLQTGVVENTNANGYVEDSYADKYSGRVYGGYPYSSHEQLTTGTDHSLFVNSIRQHDRIDLDQLAFTLGMWASS